MKPNFVNTSLRLPKEVLDYFTINHPHTKQAAIRKVLIDYVSSCTQQIEGTVDLVSRSHVPKKANSLISSPHIVNLVSQLFDFIKTNLRNCVVVHSEIDGRSSMGGIALKELEGDVLVRIESDTKNLFICVKQFRDYCGQKSVNYSQLLNELKEEGIFVGVCNKRMSKGMKMQTPTVRVLQFSTANVDELKGIAELVGNI